MKGPFLHAVNISTCFNVHFLIRHFFYFFLFWQITRFSVTFAQKCAAHWGSFHFTSLKYFCIRESNSLRVPTVKDMKKKYRKLSLWTWFINLILHQIDGYARYRGRMENYDVIVREIRKHNYYIEKNNHVYRAWGYILNVIRHSHKHTHTLKIARNLLASTCEW